MTNTEAKGPLGFLVSVRQIYNLVISIPDITTINVKSDCCEEEKTGPKYAPIFHSLNKEY